MRYAHYIDSPKGESWPSDVITVAVSYAKSGDYRVYQENTFVLTAWAMQLLRCSVEGTSLVREITGVTCTGFWNALASVAKKSRKLLLLSDHCGNAWHCLDFWGMLEDGEIIISGRDYRCGRNNGYAKERRFCGYLCIEDPPNIASFRVGTHSRGIVWCDVRNYGVELPSRLNCITERCNWLAQWFIGASDIVRQCNLGSWQNTSGSQALHGWRKSYLTTGVYAHAEPIVCGLESRAYIGGRCEAYAIGTLRGTYHQFDYRSLYPSICVENPVPVRLRNYTLNEFAAYRTAEHNAGACIADVTLETDEPDYPYRTPLPVSSGHRNGKRERNVAFTACDTEVIYPIGRFETTLCGPELVHALESNRVKDIRCIAEYDMEPALRDYAARLYGVRESCSIHSVAGIEQYVKSLLVSIVGKLGQRERLWIDCPNHATDIRYGTWYGGDGRGGNCRYRSIAGFVQRDVTLGFAPNSVPAIAGFVTSHGRTRLLGAIETARRNRVVYCDTDAVIIDDNGNDNLRCAGAIGNGELGALRHIISSDHCVIHGVKHYEIGTRSRNSGVSKREDNCTPAKAILERDRRISDYIYSGKRPAAGTDRVPTTNAVVYHHRFVADDGSTRPWVVKDGQLY